MTRPRTVPLWLLFVATCGAAACGGSGSQVPGVTFSRAESGTRPYAAAPSTSAEEAAPPTPRIEGSTIEPLGALYEPPAKLEAVAQAVLAGPVAQAVDPEGLEASLLSRLRRAMPESAPVTVFRANVLAGSVVVGSVELEADTCYRAIALVGPGLLQARLHLVTAPPWPPTVVAQSELGPGPLEMEGHRGCLTSPDARGLRAWLSPEAQQGSGEVVFALMVVDN
jgi:hypothetical protein